jgi:hypothetical protein
MRPGLPSGPGCPHLPEFRRRSFRAGTSPNFLITLASLESPRLWPHCNNTFVSAPEPLIFIYVSPRVFLAFAYRGWGTFINNQFSNPASRSAPMPAAFSMAVAPQETAPALGMLRPRGLLFQPD